MVRSVRVFVYASYFGHKSGHMTSCTPHAQASQDGGSLLTFHLRISIAVVPPLFRLLQKATMEQSTKNTGGEVKGSLAAESSQNVRRRVRKCSYHSSSHTLQRSTITAVTIHRKLKQFCMRFKTYMHFCADNVHLQFSCRMHEL